jgi:hypothetical protein
METEKHSIAPQKKNRETIEAQSSIVRVPVIYTGLRSDRSGRRKEHYEQ